MLIARSAAPNRWPSKAQRNHVVHRSGPVGLDADHTLFKPHLDCCRSHGVELSLSNSRLAAGIAEVADG